MYTYVIMYIMGFTYYEDRDIRYPLVGTLLGMSQTR